MIKRQSTDWDEFLSDVAVQLDPQGGIILGEYRFWQELTGLYSHRLTNLRKNMKCQGGRTQISNVTSTPHLEVLSNALGDL